MGESGGRRAVELDRLALELGRERRKKQMLEISIFELRNTVTELEKRLSTVEEEGNEWKTRYETQVELNKQLERQINILQDKMELIHGNPADKLSSVRTFDQMPVVEDTISAAESTVFSTEEYKNCFLQKIKGCLDYRHLWSMENVKPIYSTADTCIAGIKNTSNILFC